MAYTTPYYWQVVPYNLHGPASGCPVWSFTTWADPTITALPYTENFDGVTAPALPAGWVVADGEINNGRQWTNTANSYLAPSDPNVMVVSGRIGLEG